MFKVKYIHCYRKTYQIKHYFHFYNIQEKKQNKQMKQENGGWKADNHCYNH